jgi:hypothetical protein
MISLQEYNLLEDKLQSLMELIQNNNEAFESNMEKLKKRNLKKMEKITLEVQQKTEENEDLLRKLEDSNSTNLQQVDNFEKQIQELKNLVDNSRELEKIRKGMYVSILSRYLPYFEEDQQKFIKSSSPDEFNMEIIVSSFEYLANKLRDSMAEGENAAEVNNLLKDENFRLLNELEIYKKEQFILMENLKEKETEKISLQENVGNLEMTNQTILRNYQELNKNHETLLKESKAAEKIVEYRKKVENLVEEKLTIQNSNRLIIESLSNEIKELNAKLNEMILREQAANNENQPSQNPIQASSSSKDVPKLEIETKEEKPESPTHMKQNVHMANTPSKNSSGGFLSNFVKTIFLTETEKGKI